MLIDKSEVAGAARQKHVPNFQGGSVFLMQQLFGFDQTAATCREGNLFI
jgi:hypothetical protein